MRYIVAPRAFSRAELGRLEEIAKEWGAKGLAYLVNDGGEIRSPIAKFLSEDELAALAPEPGTTALFVADDEATVARVLGGLRLHLGRELGLAETGARALPLDRSTSRSSSATRTPASGRSCTIRSRRRCRATRAFESDPGRRARASTTT